VTWAIFKLFGNKFVLIILLTILDIGLQIIFAEHFSILGGIHLTNLISEHA
jgi:hypothetical protein